MASSPLPPVPRKVSPLHTWLSPSDSPQPADLIFVLAGKMDRKDYALQLLRQRLAPGVLFSVGRFEIRRFSKMPLPVPLDLLAIAQSVPPPQRHYFAFFSGETVSFELVPLTRFGTLTEIRALARWLNAHPDIRSLLIVSSAAHLRRIRMCCRALLPPTLAITYVSTPAASSAPPAGQDPPPQKASHASPSDTPPATVASSRDLLLELFKVLVYWILLKLA